jgi:hypothetical protein
LYFSSGKALREDPRNPLDLMAFQRMSIYRRSLRVFPKPVNILRSPLFQHTVLSSVYCHSIIFSLPDMLGMYRQWTDREITYKDRINKGLTRSVWTHRIIQNETLRPIELDEAWSTRCRGRILHYTASRGIKRNELRCSGTHLFLSA